MNALIILQRMLVLFAMMMIGYFCYKKDWIDENAYGKLSKIVVNIMNPMLIIDGVLNKAAGSDYRKILMNVVLMAVYFAVLIAVSFPTAKLLRVKVSENYLYRMMLIFSNVGFMGIPVISSLYGETCTLYIAFYILGYNLLLYTYGLHLVARSVEGQNGAKKEKAGFQWRKMLNVGVVACLVAIVIFAGNIHVPSSVESFVSYTGNAAVPLSMILIGASMAQQNVRELFADMKMYVFLAIRLLLLPVLAALIIKQFHVDGQLAGIFCLMFAMPIGSIVVLLASDQGADERLCTKGSVVSTLLSVVTIPIVAVFL